MYRKLESLGLALLDPDGTSRSAPGVIAFVALTAAIIGGALILGPYPITLFPEDAMHMLVQGDYLQRGYRPYVDYFSMHGPFPFLFSAAGLEAEGVSLWAVLTAQALGAGLFGTLIFKVAASRLHAAWAVLLTGAVELILLSCTPMGRKSWREFTPAMWYNAMCFVIVAIVYLYLLLPSRARSAASRWIDAGIVGFCLMACCLTKASFFVPLAIITAIGGIVIPRAPTMRRESLAACVLGAALTVAVMAALGGSLMGYKSFLSSLSLEVSPLALSLRFVQYTRTIGIFLVGMLLAGWAAEECGLLRELRREWALAVLMFGGLLLMVSTCKQDPEAVPLVGIIPLSISILVASLGRSAGRAINLPLITAALCVSLLLVTNEAKNSALSWVFSRMTIKTIEDPVERSPEAAAEVAEVATAERIDPELYAMMPRSWVEQNLAALRLLKEAGTSAGQTLFVAAKADSVTIMTNLRYARGDSPWLPFEFASYPERAPLAYPELLSDCDWILRDRSDDASWRYLTHNRGEYLNEHFVETSHNDDWTLYRRRPAATSPVPQPRS